MSEEILEVKIKKRELFLSVWIVPIVALIVGGWMVYKYYSKRGPTIEILFESSGGIEPKNSYIKFRDVKVGVVEEVEILKDRVGVRVVARMNRDVAPFLNETTRFWIVKPEIGMGKIRGLDALVSGAYIQMQAELGKEDRRRFVGLQEPPLDVDSKQGATVRLVAASSYDLRAGSPVYYKEIEVGKVRRVQLARDGSRVYIYLFIEKPYLSLINATTKFWKIGSIDMKFMDNGVEVRTKSLAQIVTGGIEFATKDLSQKPRLKGDFFLYPSRAEVNRKRIGVGQEHFVEFLMRFDENVGYLHVDAPVKLDGFVVGKVKDILSNVDLEHKKIDSLVIATIDVAAFRQRIDDDGFANLKALVEKGLRARLTQSNPLFDSLHVELIFTDKNGSIVDYGGVYLFPTTNAKRNMIMATVSKILQKLEQMPLERSLNALSELLEQTRSPLRDSLVELRRALVDVRALLEDRSTRALPQRTTKVLQELEQTLREYKELAKSYAEHSLFRAKLDRLLKDLDQATKEAQKLLYKLNQKPNAIIFGE